MTDALQDNRVPVTVLTGCLGAGKTTVLNHILQQTRGQRYAVIVNEFGDIGIDGELIDSGDEELIELSSGCVCCVVRGDLIRTLRALLSRETRLDGILIETTGVANPSPVIQTFYADQTLAALCRLDTVVTVVDALHIAAQLQDSADAADQIALASVILLNKASEAADPDTIAARLQALNPFAPVHRIDRGAVDAALLMNTGGLALDRIAEHLPPPDHPHDHLTQAGITSVSLSTEEPVDAALLERWLQDVLAVRGEDILRIKGIIWTPDSGKKLVIQAVHMLLEGDYLSDWDGAEPHLSRLVFIGRKLDTEALRAGFLACRATETV